MRTAVILVLMGCTASTALAKEKLSLQGDATVRALLPADKYEVVAIPPQAAALEASSTNGVLPGNPVALWWPDELQTDWENGTANCRARTGPPPFTGQKVVFCSMDLSRALYQKLVEHLGGRVLQVGVTSPAGRPGFMASARSFLPSDTSAVSLSAETMTEAQARAKLPVLIRRVLAGDGDRAARQRSDLHILDTPSAADLKAANAPAQYSATRTDRDCSAAPQKLLLTPAGDLTAQALAIRWESSMKSVAHGAPQACTWRFTSGAEKGPMGEIIAYQVHLDCGDLHLADRGIAVLEDLAERRATDQAMDALFKQFCK